MAFMGYKDQMTQSEAEAFASNILGRPWKFDPSYAQTYGANALVDTSSLYRDITSSPEYLSKNNSGYTQSGYNVPSLNSTGDLATAITLNTPWGTASKDGSTWNITESDAEKATREQREALLTDYYGRLGETPAGTEEYQQALFDQIFGTGSTALTQYLTSKGLAGENLTNEITNLAAEAGTQSALAGADYTNSVLSGIINAINAVESGQSAAAAKQFENLGYATAETTAANNLAYQIEQLKLQKAQLDEQVRMNNISVDKYNYLKNAYDDQIQAKQEEADKQNIAGTLKTLYGIYKGVSNPVEGAIDIFSSLF